MNLGKYDKRLHVHWDDQLVNAYGVRSLEGQRICLDLGCGQGLARSRFEKLEYDYVGMDIVCDEAVSAIGDAHILPFASEAFDIVYSTKVLEHIAQPWVALQEVHRVLKNGGRFFGSVAFIECFHSSYFHFTHYGLKSILEYAGFELEDLKSGDLGTVALCNTLFWPLKPGWMARLSTRAILLMRRAFAYPYAKLRYPRNLSRHSNARRLVAEDQYRFSGEFSFLAVKR